jgi:SOS response regulatory protein OraA/RecX
LFQLVKQCHKNDWLNQSKPNKKLIEQKHKMNPEHMKRLIEKLKKEGKIKD